MDFSNPLFFRKNAPIWLVFTAVLLVFGNCNPFDNGSDCPVLTGPVQVGGYKIEKVKTDRTNLFNFQFVDSLHGFALANFGRLVRTVDGGKNWTDSNIPVSNFAPFHFFTKDSGFVGRSFVNQTDFTSYFLLYKTVDGGQTTEIVGDTITGSFSHLYFFDEKTGWATGQRYVFDPVTMQDQFFYGPFSTSDGGKTWKTNPNLEPDYQQNRMSWVNKNVGYYIAQSRYLYRTTDGGENWEERQLPPNITQSPNLRFVDENFGFTETVNQFDFGSDGNAYFTKDGGQSWQQLAGPGEIVAVLDLAENQSGLMAAKSGKCGGQNANAFLVTGPGGSVLDETNPIEDNFGFVARHFGNPNQFFIVAQGGQLLKVTRQ